MSTNFTPNITSFDGDSVTMNFFLKQVEEISLINKWTPDKKLFFLKSKLVGTALTFAIQAENNYPRQTYEQFKKALVDFFSNDNPQASIMELTAFHMLPNENIRSLTYRLENLINKVYPDIPDSESLLKIKKTHLLQALPQAIKIKILEENITDFKKIAKRAQELFVIHNTATTIADTPFKKFEELAQQVNFLSEKVNSKSTSQTEGKSEQAQVNSTRGRFDQRHSRSQPSFNNYQNRPRYNFRHDYRNSQYNSDMRDRHRWFNNRPNYYNRFTYNQNNRQNRDTHRNSFPILCNFCRARHSLSECFAFKRFLNLQSNRQLNPEAITFRPHLNGQVNPR